MSWRECDYGVSVLQEGGCVLVVIEGERIDNLTGKVLTILPILNVHYLRCTILILFGKK